MNLGVSLLTNTIYAGTSKDCGNGLKKWVGKKHDVTDEAIKAVFEWFMNNHIENEPNEAYEVRFEGCPYVLRMVKRSIQP